uniref:Uncharacterized protein n=1 Tax=Myotis myotis TaxID=51298 RepID=A0A7J7WHT8_MYOMY|nr:hypothetical protein mMyoMyo1_012096 [Myotis myotis]
MKACSILLIISAGYIAPVTWQTESWDQAAGEDAGGSSGTALAMEAQTGGASGDIQSLVKHLPMEPTWNTSRGDWLAKKYEPHLGSLRWVWGHRLLGGGQEGSGSSWVWLGHWETTALWANDSAGPWGARAGGSQRQGAQLGSWQKTRQTV